MAKIKYEEEKMKIIISFLTSLFLVMTLTAKETKIYAVVNGDQITEQTIAIALKDPKANFDALPKDTKKNILDRIIEQKLLSQKALTTNIVNDKIYKQTLKSLKQDLALQVWMQKISKDIVLSTNEIKEFYKKNKKNFKKSAQIKARHILVATKKEAQNIIKTLKSSKNLLTKFKQLAKEKSTGPSSKNGGDLGWFSPEQMVPAFSQAASSLKINSITTIPVKTQYGFHIIYLEDKKKSSIANFQSVKLKIKQQLQREKFIQKIQEIVENLKKKAKIQYK
jgi:parvulin-like peptidyl-prolyl isomerase